VKREYDIEIKDELIVRYLAGEAGPEEAMALQDWLTFAENRAYFESIQRTWEQAHPAKTPRAIDAQHAWKKIDLQTEPAVMWKSKRSRHNTLILRIAASLLITFLATLLIYIRFYKPSVEMMAVSTTDALKNVSLPDNSTAILHHSSKLVYPASFGEKQRNVELAQGEAFFTVTSDAEKPFIIHTSVADIRVVGTAFNVALQDNQLEVSVKEGKVLVYTSQDSSYLRAGSTGIVQPAMGTIRVKESVHANSWGYATHQLIFKDASLEEVIADIEKAYPCSITLGNANINNCRLTATFDNDSAENLLTLLAETLNLSVVKNGTVYTLQGEGCP
jgi:ferric-dicitrate binding protein FerR (iron transport regulator)